MNVTKLLLSKPLRVVGVLALLYVLLSPPVAWPIYSRVLFRPKNDKLPIDSGVKLIEDINHAKRKLVTFKSSNGKTLHGWIFELPNTRKIVLSSGGCGGNIYRRINYARMLLPLGVSVFQYDYQGYGQSEGTPSLGGVCEDVVAAYDYLIEHEHRTSEDIIAFGESFGTGPTGQLVARRPVSAVVLSGGYPSLLRAGRDTLPWLWLYPDKLFPRQMLDNIAVFRKPHPPLLIVHGTNDRVLSYRNIKHLYDEAREPKMLLTVKNGNHCAFGKSEEFGAAFKRLLEQTTVASK